jgi:hypothetical protein
MVEVLPSVLLVLTYNEHCRSLYLLTDWLWFSSVDPQYFNAQICVGVQSPGKYDCISLASIFSYSP